MFEEDQQSFMHYIVQWEAKPNLKEYMVLADIDSDSKLLLANMLALIILRTPTLESLIVDMRKYIPEGLKMDPSDMFGQKNM